MLSHWLQARTKQLKFGKSRVHAWGLFAQEAIAAEEFLIEYIGEVIPSGMEDVRERQYQKQGLDSSYLFRIDKDFVIDATKKAGLSLGRAGQAAGTSPMVYLQV